MVEHNLAKVGVASSSLVSRSRIIYLLELAGWQNGYAAACKAVYAGSIPTPASNELPNYGAETVTCNNAAMAEQVDARDLKSLGNKIPVPVRFRLAAPSN